jgi:hypothetical protein
MPFNYPYPEPDRSSPCPYKPIPEDSSEYNPPIYARVFQVASFRTETQHEPLIPLYVLHGTISFFLISSPEKFWRWYLLLNSLLFSLSTPLLPRPS